MKYTVSYTEMLGKTVIVEANSKEEAERKVLEAVENEEIVLTTADYLDDSGEISDSWETSKLDEDYYEQI